MSTLVDYWWNIEKKARPLIKKRIMMFIQNNYILSIYKKQYFSCISAIKPKINSNFYYLNSKRPWPRTYLYLRNKPQSVMVNSFFKSRDWRTFNYKQKSNSSYFQQHKNGIWQCHYYLTSKFSINSLKGVLLVNFPEKEKHFFIKNLAAENKISLITQYASLLLKDSRNIDDLLGVEDPIQALFDQVKASIPCICFINDLDSIGKQRYENKSSTEFPKNNGLVLPNNINSSNTSVNSNNIVVNKTNPLIDLSIYNCHKKVYTMRHFLGHRSKNFQQWFFSKQNIFECIHVLAKNQDFKNKRQWPGTKKDLFFLSTNKAITFNIIDQLFFFNKKTNIRLSYSLGYRLPFWLYPKKSQYTKLLNSSKFVYNNNFSKIKGIDLWLKQNKNAPKNPNTFIKTHRLMPYDIDKEFSYPINVLKQKFTNKYTVTEKTVNTFLLTTIETNDNEDHLLKMNETEIIKRTALLKFLQILDGFDSKLIRTNNIFFFNNLLADVFFQVTAFKKNSIKILPGQRHFFPIHLFKKGDQLKRVFFSLYIWIYSFFIKPFYNSIKQRHKFTKYSIPISQTNALIHNNKSLCFQFFKPLRVNSVSDSLKIWPSSYILNTKENKKAWPVKFKKQLLINRYNTEQLSKTIQDIKTNSFFFGSKNVKLIESKKNHRREAIFFKPLKWSTYSKSLAPNVYLMKAFDSKKKTNPTPEGYFTFNNNFGSIELYLRILEKRLCKDYLYINNEMRSQKTLNLLCVWPCYNEDILGSSLNDSGSYILPEYFQLLNIGPKLKKLKVTMIASTNNVTTLDAALLRPGRFDTFINFAKSDTRRLFSNKNTKIVDPSKLLNFAANRSFVEEPLIQKFSNNSPVFLNKTTNFNVIKILGSGFLKKEKFRQSFNTINSHKLSLYKTFTNSDEPPHIKNRNNISLINSIFPNHVINLQKVTTNHSRLSIERDNITHSQFETEQDKIFSNLIGGNRSKAFKNFLELFIFGIYKSYEIMRYSNKNLFELNSSTISLIGNDQITQDSLKSWPVWRRSFLYIKNFGLLDAQGLFYASYKFLNSKFIQFKLPENISLQNSDQTFESLWTIDFKLLPINIKTKDLQYLQKTSLQNQLKTSEEFDYVFHYVLGDQIVFTDHAFNLNNNQNQNGGLNDIFLNSIRQLLFSNGSIYETPEHIQNKGVACKAITKSQSLLICGGSSEKKKGSDLNKGSGLQLFQNNTKNVLTSKTSKLAKYNSIYKKKIKNQSSFFQLYSIISILMKRKNLLKPSKLRFYSNTSYVNCQTYEATNFNSNKLETYPFSRRINCENSPRASKYSKDSDARRLFSTDTWLDKFNNQSFDSKNTSNSKFNNDQHNSLLVDSFMSSTQKSNSLETYTTLSKHYKMSLLETTIFLLIFYNMYVSSSMNYSKRFISSNKTWPVKYQNNILSTIKISMPYKSVLFSHWLLLQNEASNFSGEPIHIQNSVGRSIEILIFNKFKNFLVNSTISSPVNLL